MYCKLMKSFINNNYGHAPPSFGHVGLIFRKLNGDPKKVKNMFLLSFNW